MFNNKYALKNRFRPAQYVNLIDEIDRRCPTGKIDQYTTQVVYPDGTLGVVKYNRIDNDDNGEYGSVTLEHGDTKSTHYSLMHALDGFFYDCDEAEAKKDEPETTEDPETTDTESNQDEWIDTAMMDHYDMANGDIGDTDLFESAIRPATDKEKYFLYKIDTLKTPENSAKLEAVVKAFGLIRKVDTTLSDHDKEMFAYFESLEKARGNQPKKAFIESITNEAMKRVNKEQFGEVRNAINAYRTWIFGKTHACMESMTENIDNYNSIVNELKQEGATITDAASFANKLSEHGIQATVKNDTVTVQRPDGTFDDYKPWGQFTNGTPRWVKLWSDDYGRMNYLDPSSLLVDVFMAAHKLPDV